MAFSPLVELKMFRARLNRCLHGLFPPFSGIDPLTETHSLIHQIAWMYEYWMSGIFSSLFLTFTLWLFNLQEFWNSFCLNNLSDQLSLYRLVTERGLKILTLWIYHFLFKSLMIKQTRQRQLGLTFHILKLGLNIIFKIIPEVYILLWLTQMLTESFSFSFLILLALIW